MEPVVSPWLFYFAGVSRGLVTLSGMLGVVAAGVAIGVFAYRACENRGPGAVLGVPLCLLALLLWLGAALLPSKQTIIEMAIAQNVTVERLAKSADVVKKVYQDILRLAERATESKKGDGSNGN